MPFEVDTRKYGNNDKLHADQVGFSITQEAVPNVNALTGTPNLVNVQSNLPLGQAFAFHSESDSTATLSMNSMYVKEAMRLAREASKKYPLNQDPIEYQPDPVVHRTTSGASIVHLQQTYHGIPVFQMGRTVRFSSEGNAVELVGNDAKLSPDLPVTPINKPVEAVKRAIAHIRESLPAEVEQPCQWGPMPETAQGNHFSIPDDYILENTAAFDLSNMPTVFSAKTKDGNPLFERSIDAQLVLWYEQSLTARLGWQVDIALPGNRGTCQLIVAADKANLGEPLEILYSRKNGFNFAVADIPVQVNTIEGKVYWASPPEPQNFASFPFPLTPEKFPWPIHIKSPQAFSDWCTKASPCSTVGDNVAASDDSLVSINVIANEGRIQFDAQSIGATQEEQERLQRIINLFYFCNYMHNLFLLFGFDEAAGAFQKVKTGVAGDPVIAQSFSQPVWGIANLTPSPDGTSPVLQAGFAASGRHAALDADVIFHEYTHGVTNRLVGGRINIHALQEPQSRGMGEGYSDYYSLTVQNYLLRSKDFKTEEKTVIGDWLINDKKGIREMPYTADFSLHFNNLNNMTDQTAPHKVGSIWCAALMQMNRELAQVFPKNEGPQDPQLMAYRLGLQLVTDSLKLMPQNPSFLDGRDAIFKALRDLNVSKILDDTQYKSAKQAIWLAFNRFSMGPKANCNGASIGGGIIADGTLSSGDGNPFVSATTTSSQPAATPDLSQNPTVGFAQTAAPALGFSSPITPPNTNIHYYLMSYDANGNEFASPGGAKTSDVVLNEVKSKNITDIFILCHGWMTDLPNAKSTYDEWLGVMASCNNDLQAIRSKRKNYNPLIVGIHWPSKPWGDEHLGPTALSFGNPDYQSNIAFKQNLAQDYVNRLNLPADLDNLELIGSILDEIYANPNATEMSLSLQAAYSKLYEKLQPTLGLNEEVAVDPLDNFQPKAIYQDVINYYAVQSFGIGNITSALLSPLRVLSFWQMKKRACRVGEQALGPWLEILNNAAKNQDFRIHLIGHSFGCITISAAVLALVKKGIRPQNSKIHTLMLVQGAMSLWAYADAENLSQFGIKQPGYFNAVPSLVNGCILTTRSQFDTANKLFYPAGAALANHTSYFGGSIAYPKFGAVGTFGLQGISKPSNNVPLRVLNEPYQWTSKTLSNLDSNSCINRSKDPFSGAHTDILHPEVAHAFLSACLV